MAELKPIQKGDDLRQDWRKINELLSEMLTLKAEVRRLAGAVAELRGRPPHIAPGSQGTTPTIQGAMNYRGEYSYVEAYSIRDVVKVSYGGYAGTYLCKTAVPANTVSPPWTGAYWVLLGKCIDAGNWV